jgi:hypothetical protein
MKHLAHLSAALILLACATGVAAQTAPSKPGTATRKPAAKTTRPAPPPPKETSLTPPASQEQLDAAERALFGDYECEFNQKINVSLHPKEAGYIEVKHLNKVFTMRPVMSSTGALRLEDVRGQTLLLQIANKSMLMDVKAGKRIVDSCTHASQREFMKNAPTATPVLN